eukprot:TRINITY_DN25277_c0_g1_i1.p1 TRINITY_DN25277_c0_g1~~TRINITY_DN25277_c0_g1_i1.p1  ORF type:complete len:393 (+),score=87.41 TRINITY_DN25277_c0_g1_i1:50-1180(+)
MSDTEETNNQKETKGEEKPGQGNPEEKKLKFDRNKTIWENIAASKPQSTETQEVNVLVMGGKKAGKSTLIQRFVKREETTVPKPTTALEYSYGRREEGKKIQIAQFWEIGGGSELHRLVDVVVTPENIHTLICVVVLDLSDPRTLWETFMSCMAKVNKRASECFVKMRAKNNSTPDKLLQRHKKKIGDDHEDLSQLQLNGIPMVVIGTKFDLFQDNPHIRVMSKTLRYLCHRHGMHLTWVSTKDESSMTKYKSLMANLVFGTAFQQKHMNTDFSKGQLMIWPGWDSFKNIGPPVGLQQVPPGFVSTNDPELDNFKQPFDDAYPPKATQKQEKDTFTSALYEEFSEPAIDSLRAQKEEVKKTQAKERATSRRESNRD